MSSVLPVVELRHYTTHPGTRDTLITLFEREFIETQEAAGIQLIAQFRDIDRPDVYTWLRGFPDMQSRAASLAAFYDGPVWAAHRDAANATMIDSDDVRLLRIIPLGPQLSLIDARPKHVAIASAPELIVATIYTLRTSAAPTFAEMFHRSVAPRLATSGAQLLASFETEPSSNSFPRLPIREGEHAFVYFTRFANTADYDRHSRALDADSAWRAAVRRDLEETFAAPPIIWRLTPTTRSLRWR